MSEEENKIVEKFKKLYLKDFYNEKIMNEDRLSYLECALISNLIEKQQKEIKELKEKYDKDTHTLQNKLETTELSNRRLRYKLDQEKQCEQYTKQLENIVKFAITNHIGNLQGGMRIEKYGIDKMQNLKLNINYEPEYNSYVIRVNY